MEHLSEPEQDGPSERMGWPFDRPKWRAILEVIGVFQVTFVLPLALLARWLPNKRGGDMDFAPYFMDEPTYIESVLVNIIILNVLLFAIGTLLIVAVKVLEARDSRTG